MDAPKENPDELVQLRQQLEETTAEGSRLQQAIRAREDAVLLELHTRAGLPDTKTLIARLKQLDNALERSATPTATKEAIRTDLVAGLTIGAAATKHKVSKRVVAGIQSKIPKATVAS